MPTYWLFAISLSATAWYDKDYPWWARVAIWVAVLLPCIFIGDRIDEVRKAKTPRAE